MTYGGGLCFPSSIDVDLKGHQHPHLHLPLKSQEALSLHLFYRPKCTVVIVEPDVFTADAYTTDPGEKFQNLRKQNEVSHVSTRRTSLVRSEAKAKNVVSTNLQDTGRPDAWRRKKRAHVVSWEPLRFVLIVCP